LLHVRDGVFLGDELVADFAIHLVLIQQPCLEPASETLFVSPLVVRGAVDEKHLGVAFVPMIMAPPNRVMIFRVEVAS
jgi:hypothetical protein